MSEIRSAAELAEYLESQGLTWEECALPEANEFTGLFPVRIPRFYANLIDWRDASDPLRLMVLPDSREKNVKDYELADPIGDKAHEPVPGLVHRYPDRCLLLLTSHCGVHCRFCFRREVVGKVRPIDIAGIREYLRSHEEICEVIFSGGDPATFPPAFLRSMITPLTRLKHIKTLRIHSRALVVDPSSFSEDWLSAFAEGEGSRIVVLHINHPREVTKELAGAVSKLRTAGVRVLSQSVLLSGVNDNRDTLLQLFNTLSEAGIDPYYLHHLDKARGTHHFRVSIEAGKALFQSLRGQIAGHKLPEYVLDLPGSDGKVPVMWLKPVGQGDFEVMNFRGKLVTYHDPMEDEQ